MFCFKLEVLLINDLRINNIKKIGFSLLIIKKRRIKYGIFCQVRSNQIVKKFLLKERGKNQLWKGAIPIFNSKINWIIIIFLSTRKLVYKLCLARNKIINNLERAWIRKYIIVSSLFEVLFCFTKKAMKLRVLSSMAIHRLNQELKEKKQLTETK